MKTLIPAAIIALSSSAAMAGAFDFERQFGTPALFPTLDTEQSTAKNTGPRGPTSFAYERAIGTPALFPTLNAEGYALDQTRQDRMVDNVRVHDTIWGWDFPVGG